MSDVDVSYAALGWRTYKWTTLISSMRWRATTAAQHIEAARASGRWSEEYLFELTVLQEEMRDIARSAQAGFAPHLRERHELREQILARHPHSDEFSLEEKRELLDHAATFDVSRHFALCDEVKERYEQRVLSEGDEPPWWPWTTTEIL